MFDQKECVFLSHVQPVMVGQQLLIKNSDPIGHNTNIAPPGDQGVNPLLSPGGEFEHKFSFQQNNPVAVTCNIHPWMKAYVFPRGNPYFAITDKEGKFEIKNVPAGEPVEFRLWHESADTLAPGDWSRGRKMITVPENGVTDLGKIEVSPDMFGKVN